MSVCHSDISYDRTDDDVVKTPPTHRAGDPVTGGLLSHHPLVCSPFVAGSGHQHDQTSEISSPRAEGEFTLPV